MTKVYLTRNFPGEGMERLKKHFEVAGNFSWLAPGREELLRQLEDTEVLFTYNDVIDSGLLDAATRLKLIVDHWGGGAVDREAAAGHGITIARVPESYGWIVNGVADLVWGMMINAGRRFQECSRFIRDGRFSHSEQSNHLLLGQGLHGRTLGILGAGRIGRAVAARAGGFGMNLIYYDIAANEEIEGMGARLVGKDELFACSDYLTVHLSDVDENRHFIGEQELDQMKEDAILINTARGRMIDERALVKALQEKKIGGAALEVYEFEPEVSKEFFGMPNVLLLPHMGGALLRERSYIFSCMVDACMEYYRIS